MINYFSTFFQSYQPIHLGILKICKINKLYFICNNNNKIKIGKIKLNWSQSFKYLPKSSQDPQLIKIEQWKKRNYWLSLKA